MGIESREYMKRDENDRYILDLGSVQGTSAGEASWDVAVGAEGRLISGYGWWIGQQLAALQFLFLFGCLVQLRLESLAAAGTIHPQVIAWLESASAVAIVASLVAFGFLLLLTLHVAVASIRHMTTSGRLSMLALGAGLVLLDGCLIELGVAHQRDADEIAHKILGWGIPLLGLVGLVVHRPLLLLNRGPDGLLLADARAYRNDRLLLVLVPLLVAALVLLIMIPSAKEMLTGGEHLPGLLGVSGLLAIAVRGSLQMVLPGQAVSVERYLGCGLRGLLVSLLPLLLVAGGLFFWGAWDELPQDVPWVGMAVLICLGSAWGSARFGS